jgi:hypothetical protein
MIIEEPKVSHQDGLIFKAQDLQKLVDFLALDRLLFF